MVLKAQMLVDLHKTTNLLQDMVIFKKFQKRTESHIRISPKVYVGKFHSTAGMSF